MEWGIGGRGEREGIERGSLYAHLLEGWKIKIRWRMESLGADDNHGVRAGNCALGGSLGREVFSGYIHILCQFPHIQALQLGFRFPKFDSVGASSDSFQSHLHRVPILQPQLRFPSHAHTLRSPCEDHISWQQCRSLTQKCNGLCDSKDHVFCI